MVLVGGRLYEKDLDLPINRYTIFLLFSNIYLFIKYLKDYLKDVTLFFSFSTSSVSIHVDTVSI